MQVIQQPMQNQTYLPQIYNTSSGQILMPSNIQLHPGINPQQIQVIAAGKQFQGNQITPHMLTTATSQGKPVLQTNQTGRTHFLRNFSCFFFLVVVAYFVFNVINIVVVFRYFSVSRLYNDTDFAKSANVGLQSNHRLAAKFNTDSNSNESTESSRGIF